VFSLFFTINVYVLIFERNEKVLWKRFVNTFSYASEYRVYYYRNSYP